MDDLIIESQKKTVKLFHNFFSTIVKMVSISQNDQIDFIYEKSCDPVIKAIEDYSILVLLQSKKIVSLSHNLISLLLKRKGNISEM